MNATSRFASAQEHATPRRTLRSLGAVLAGLLTIVILSTATDAVLHATGVYPPPGLPPMRDELFLVATAYRVVYAVLAGYVTARVAPHHPIGHALVLGAIGVVLSTVGAIVMWEYGPPWYSLAVIAISLPCAWAGAALYVRRTRRDR